MRMSSGFFGYLAGLFTSLSGGGAAAQAPDAFDVILQDCINFVRSHNQQLPDQWTEIEPPEITTDDEGTEAFGEANIADGTIRVLHRAYSGVDGYRFWTCDLNPVDRENTALTQAFVQWVRAPGLDGLEAVEVKDTPESTRRFFLESSDPGQPVQVQLVERTAPGTEGHWEVYVELSPISGTEPPGDTE